MGKGIMALLALVLLACQPRGVEQALGTLEWDRIELTASRSETIVSMAVREGQYVQQGDLLMQLDARKARAELQRLRAALQHSEARLAERVRGPRQEEIAEARARLEGAESRWQEARLALKRTRTLVEQQLASVAQLDQAKTAYDSAAAQLAANRQVVKRLVNGTTREQLDQAASIRDEARAAWEHQQLLVEELSLRASRDGVVDSLPYQTGERPPPGAVVAVILAGTAPYARVYLHENARLRVVAGQPLTVHIDGLSLPIVGTVRSVSSDPVFTPYYSLSERDRGRLSYIAEVVLPPEQSAHLTPGVAVQVDLPGAG